MSASKEKGTRAETALAEYLRGYWPYAERRALCGSVDKGDIAGIPGVVWECKAGERLCIPQWLAETECERVNAGAELGILAVKPKGVGTTNVGRWWAIKPLEHEVLLLRTAGF